MSLQLLQDKAMVHNQVSVDLQKLENEMLEMPQEDCPVEHFFSDGVYVRQVTLRAGLFALGHRQKKQHMNIMLKGRVLMLAEDGNVTEIVAPYMSIGQAGRKAGLILEDVVWLNVYATDKTDIAEIEGEFLDKTIDFNLYEARKFEFECATHDADRKDFLRVISDFGFTPDEVRSVSENTTDQIDMPEEWRSLYSIRQSPIEGAGVFSSANILAGQKIAPARIKDKRTPIGRYCNHAINANCYFEKSNNGDIFLISKKDITGCVSGSYGEELTVNYKEVLENLCQV